MSSANVEQRPAIELEIEAHRPFLLRLARLQLGAADTAEGIVQDTLLAALRNAGSFQGRSSVKTWLTSILKHKAIDAFHRQQREANFSSFAEKGDDEDMDAFFDSKGRWVNMPVDWGDGLQRLEQKDFLRVMDSCLEGLPPKQARAFVMREVFEADAEQACKDLGVSLSNLWVLMYRARMALRQCLRQKGFRGGNDR